MNNITHSAEHYYPLAHKLITGAIIFLIFFLIAWIMGRILHHFTKKNDARLALTFGRLVRNLLLIVGVIVAISSTGANISGIVAGLGLGALAIGYGMQYIFANVGAGFMIMLSGEIKKGDNITIYGSSGVVINMNLRYITLQNGDNLFVIPNNLFVTYPITKTVKQEN
ncbi:MAG: mechanosensitive ion channel [Gammaproteobacteria bacterium]|nr:mechanosensitive ion channel [Gammaproteobacteria bacterium]